MPALLNEMQASTAVNFRYFFCLLDKGYITKQGGYFCDLLLPMAYPSLKEVKHKLITAIRPSIVNIGIPSFSKIFDRQAVDFFNRGSQSLC